MSTGEIYEFGEIRVDRSRMTIERGGRPVSVEPKAFDVLLHLIQNRDRLTTKEELLDTVWRGTFVTPNVVARCVTQLRRALGDDAREARYLQTVAKRGYRFIAPVTVSSNGSEPAAPAPVVAPARAPSRWPAVALAGLLVVGLLGLVFSLRDQPAPAIVLERVTTRLGYNGSPAISPDGSRVAFVSDRSGSMEIVVTGFARGARELPITNDGGNNDDPAWSPDGQWLAYRSRTRGGIWVVPSSGGSSRQIVEAGRAPAWSPDGRSLVFETESATPLESVLWMVDRDGSRLRQLTHTDKPVGGHHQPRWSASGKWIAFVLFKRPTAELCIVDVGTRKVTSLGAVRDVGHPSFVDDDRAIVWTGVDDHAQPAVFRRAFDARTGTTTGPVERLQTLAGRPDGLSVSRGQKAVVGIASADDNLWAIDLDDEGRATSPRRLTEAAVRNGYGNYSRTGRIAYVETATGDPNLTTWLMNDDGTNREALLVDRVNGGTDWSSDGKRVLVRWDPKPGEQRFWWVDVATRRLAPIQVRGEGVLSARLSPDDRDIAYHARRTDGVTNVWIQPLDGGAPRQVTSDAKGASHPVWSPDGRTLAVEIHRGGSTHVGVVSREGGTIRQLTNERGQSWPHSWSPDGNWIAFAGERAAIWNLYAVSVTTGEVRTLTDFRSVDTYVRYPSWSPNGRRIVFERSQTSAGVWSFGL